jgi:hypothetical protein
MRFMMIGFLAFTMAVAATATGQILNEDFKILASDGSAGDDFGYSTSVSSNIIVIGAPYDDINGTNSGSAYLFDTTTGQQIVKLLPSDSDAHDRFGASVAISGTTAIIGAYQNDDNGIDSGSAYLFDTTTGQQIAKLLPSDGAAGDEFGRSVAIYGTTAIVGAWLDDDNGTDSGSAYLFDTTTGQEIAKLLPRGGANGDWFGWSVAISSSVAIVGARFDDDNGHNSGSVFVFDIGSGQQLSKILPDDGTQQDEFGWSVAIDGTNAIVGAFWDDSNGYASGSSYIFDLSNPSIPLQIAKLIASDGSIGDQFGVSVAITSHSGSEYAIVGAHQDDGNGNGDQSGSAYLFMRDGANWTELSKLLPSDGSIQDHFGISVANNGTCVVVGAYKDDDNGDQSGSVYVFDTSGNDTPILGPATMVIPIEAPSGFDISVQYSITNPSADPIDLFLGASIQPIAGGDYISSSECEGCDSDAIVTVPGNADDELFYRCFHIPCGIEPGEYNVTYAIWAPDGPDCGPAPGSDPYDSLTYNDLTVLTCLGDLIQITSPAGGEQWITGDLQAITWDSDPTIGPEVEIQYSPDDGDNWQQVVATAPNTGVYIWSVPIDFSTQVRVKIIGSDGQDIHLDISNPFTTNTLPGTVAEPFDGTNLDPSLWSIVDGEGIAGETLALEENIEPSHGELNITIGPTSQSDSGVGGEIYSTIPRRYGEYGVRMRGPQRAGNPAENTTSGFFTYSHIPGDSSWDNNHEIDVELRVDDSGNSRVDLITWVRYYEPDDEPAYIRIEYDAPFDPCLSFHDYRILWSPDSIAFFVDGEPAEGELIAKTAGWVDLPLGVISNEIRPEHFEAAFGTPFFPSRSSTVRLTGWSEDPQGWCNGCTTDGGTVVIAAAYFPMLCEADFNSDGIVDSQDFIAFINAFVANDPTADFNGDGDLP